MASADRALAELHRFGGFGLLSIRVSYGYSYGNVQRAAAGGDPKQKNACDGNRYRYLGINSSQEGCCESC
eukprot:scaffold95720_cov31-Prasinocladus_malaysianus.AAC.2